MNETKVIFLDIDGVLNDVATEDRTPDGFVGLNDLMISNLERIVKETDAKIVLVSTWKVEWDKILSNRTTDGEYLDARLADHNIVISDKTEDSVLNRGHGIVNWLSQHPEVERWVVLDDDVFYDYHTCGIMPHLINTHYHCGGLTEGLANEAISHLNNTGGE